MAENSIMKYVTKIFLLLEYFRLHSDFLSIQISINVFYLFLICCYRFQYANGKKNEIFDAAVADKFISSTSDFGQRLKEMTVKDLKTFILGISDEVAEELISIIPKESLHKECVMNICQIDYL